MKKFLLAIWESPQKILAHIIIKFSNAERIGKYKDAKIYYWKKSKGMSLSTYIFVPFEWFNEDQWQLNYVKHQYGHSLQSKYLGVFYLILISLPSLLWGLLSRKYCKKNKTLYYSFYTEKWADKLGGAKH